MSKRKVEVLNMSRMADPQSRVAEVIVYGEIGYDWWEDDDNTDKSFAKLFSEIRKTDYDRVNLRLNSYGGSVKHGMGIISVLNRSEVPVHVYNDGLVASMAGVIMLSVPMSQRHFPSNGLMMLHAASSAVWGNAADMREAADALDAHDKALANSVIDAPEGYYEQYHDGRDHWLTADEALEAGLIDEIKDPIDTAPPADITNYSYEQIQNYFAGQPKKKNGITNIFAALKRRFSVSNSAIDNNENIEIVDKTTISEALANGDITQEDLQAIVDANKAPEPPVDATAEAVKALEARFDDMKATHDTAIEAEQAKTADAQAQLADLKAKFDKVTQTPAPKGDDAPDAPVADAAVQDLEEKPKRELRPAEKKMAELANSIKVEEEEVDLEEEFRKKMEA